MSEWGKLWTEDTRYEDGGWIVNKDWLYEVKAVGDALQEKVDELKDWERIAREQADTLLLQQGNIEKLKEKLKDE